MLLSLGICTCSVNIRCKELHEIHLGERARNKYLSSDTDSLKTQRKQTTTASSFQFLENFMEIRPYMKIILCFSWQISIKYLNTKFGFRLLGAVLTAVVLNQKRPRCSIQSLPTLTTFEVQNLPISTNFIKCQSRHFEPLHRCEMLGWAIGYKPALVDKNNMASQAVMFFSLSLLSVM